MKEVIMLAWLMSLFSTQVKADEYTDHYDNMQGIVTGIISDTVNTVSPYYSAEIDTQAANQTSLEIGKQVAPVVQAMVGGGVASLTYLERIKRLEQFRDTQHALNASQQALNTSQQALNTSQIGINNLVRDLQTSQALSAMQGMVK